MHPSFPTLLIACWALVYAGCGVQRAVPQEGRPSSGNGKISQDLAELSRFSGLGFPDPGGYVAKRHFALGFDCRSKLPRWSVERLSWAMTQGRAQRRGLAFLQDPSLALECQAEDDDYRGSGFDRGHLVPAADMKFDPQAMQETFVFSNCAPQVGPGFNRGIWQRLEATIRGWTLTYEEIWVYTALTLPPESGPGFEAGGLPVPRRWAKVLYREQPHAAALAFSFENRSYPKGARLEDQVVSIDQVEAETGLDFFHRLEDGQECGLEQGPGKMWGEDGGWE